MIQLLDLNLLIALAWPSHVHHPQAHAWFADRAPSGWATCLLPSADLSACHPIPGSSLMPSPLSRR
jgi:uncharacterized protein